MYVGKDMMTNVPDCELISRDCIAMRVRLLNRIITKIYDDCLRRHGLRATQMNILVAVSLMRTASPSELERRLCLDKSTVSRNVDRIQRRGWVEFVPGKDKRSHHLQVTALGAKLLAKAGPTWQQAQEKAVSLLGKDGVAALARIDAALGTSNV
jgi:DNA-binding MarR family transcriptional regulator